MRLRSFSRQRATIAGFRSQPVAVSPAAPSASAPAADSVWHDDWTKEQKVAFMKAHVMPRMSKVFQAADAARYADFTCKTCHGTNLDGVFLGCKYGIPALRRAGGGSIINMASINGLVGFAGKAAYNSAKHGVIGLTKVTALEGAAHGITVNALAPGYVDTPLVRNQLADLARTRSVPLERVLEEVIYPLVPMRRLLSVEEISAYALFLTGEKARTCSRRSESDPPRRRETDPPGRQCGA